MMLIYVHLSSFSKNIPLRYALSLNNYKGDYPSSKLINTKNIENACSFEIVNEELLTAFDNLPLWLKLSTDKKELFNSYLEKDDLKSAWLTLNSKGWLLKDVAESLRLLKTKTTDKLFHLVTDNWINSYRNSDTKETDRY